MSENIEKQNVQPVEQNKKVSVVIVYTNTEQLDEAVKCLKEQTFYPLSELVLLDNREKRFSSAASALNYGAERATGEVVVFMHQDVYLWQPDFLEKYYEFLNKNPRSIIGLAGVCKDDALRYFDGCTTKNKIYDGRQTGGKILLATTLDECLLAMSKALWQDLKFDEVACDNWHFYGGDICYANLLSGGTNYIFSTREACHESTGSAYNKSFRRSFKKIIKKYKGKIKRIHTTCVNIKCNYFWYYIYCVWSKVSEILKRGN